jgi:uncharacterized protein YciI
VLFFFHCPDRPGSVELRRRTRAAHLEYMIAAQDRIAFGGPLLDDGGVSVGSVFAMHFGSRGEAEAWLAGEPYTAAGLFDRVTIVPMRAMVPEPRPGFLAAELRRERGAAAP